MVNYQGRCIESDLECEDGYERVGEKRPERSEKLQKMTWGEVSSALPMAGSTSPSSAKLRAFIL